MVELLNGDCFELLKEIPDDSIDLVCTDIPYNISKEKDGLFRFKKCSSRQSLDFGEWDHNFETEKLQVLASKVKKNGSMFIFHSFEQYIILKNIFEDTMDLKNRLIWAKTNSMPLNRDRRYINNIEMASWFTKKKGKWTFNRKSDKYDTCVFSYPVENSNKRFHPTQKNLQLMEDIILRHSNKDDVVLDCFMGGGTTGVACVRNGRNFIGIEQDAEYFEKAKKRIDNEVEKGGLLF